MSEPNAQGLTFGEWYSKVDLACSACIGLGIDDLPDWASRAFFDDGMTPPEALAARFDLSSEQLASMTGDQVSEHLLENGLF